MISTLPGNRSLLRNTIVYTILILFSCCTKRKPSDPPPPPVVNNACRLTYYFSTQDLGGNGSKYGLSYDENFNLVQATGFTLQDIRGVTVKIGPTGVNRDNGAAVRTYSYPVNIYTANPSSSNTTIVSNITEKRSETYKYDDKKRLVEVNLTNDINGLVLNQIYYKYDDNDNNVETNYIGGGSNVITTVRAKYDDHPSAYVNIPGRKFMHWIESFEVWNSDYRYTFDMMSAHNILEWEQIKYNQAGIATGSYKATFDYKYELTGRPESRTESYYDDGVLKWTNREVFTYTGCD